MNRIGFLSISMLALGLTTGCSALYVGHRDQARTQCERQPTVGERVACRQQYSTSYDQYEKQRQTLQQAHPDRPGQNPASLPE